MRLSSTPILPTGNRNLSFLFLGLNLLEGAAALLWILSVPSDKDVWRFLGYSAQRWVIILAALFLTILFSALLILARRAAIQPGDDTGNRTRGYLIAVRTTLFILALVSLRAIFFLQTFDHPAALSIYARVLPLSILLALLSMQLGLYLFIRIPPVLPAGLRMAGILWATFTALGLLLLLTRFGLVQISHGWYEYGVPLLHIQVLDMFLFALLALALAQTVTHLPALQKLRHAVPTAWVDAALMLLVWSAAILVWLPMPIPDTWMSPVPLPPNHAVYPNSDAMLYDSAAQGILLGTGWARTTAHYKPLYVAFLALAHAAAGYGYEPVIPIQTFVLALFPALLYLTGRLVHRRVTGLIIAAAVILREYNQLAVGSDVTSSNTKLLLSELPTAIGITAIMLALIWWLRAPRRRSLLALLLGGLIGLTAQVRMQAVAFLPSLIVLAALYYGRQWKASLRIALMLALGFSLSLALLLARNARTTGVLTIEKPGYMERTLDYAFTPTTGQNFGRAWMIGSGFVHNTVQALLVLPSGFHGQKAWTNLSDLTGRFWLSEATDLPPAQAAWVLVNLGVIGLGVAAAWQGSRFAALVPALAFGIYNLASAAGGFSGQRFALPVDWVGYFYFAIGLATLAGVLVSTPPRASSPSTPEQPRIQAGGWQALAPFAAVGLALLLIGGLLPIIEAVLPVHYDTSVQAGARETLAQMAVRSLDSQSLSAFQVQLNQPDTIVLRGVALYPREIRGEMAPGSFISTDPEIGAPFLTYLYQGQVSATVLQPLNGSSSKLPHASEVLMAGHWVRGRFHAFATAQPLSGKLYFTPAKPLP